MAVTNIMHTDSFYTDCCTPYSISWYRGTVGHPAEAHSSGLYKYAVFQNLWYSDNSVALGRFGRRDDILAVHLLIAFAYAQRALGEVNVCRA